MSGDVEAALEQYRAAVRLSPGLARAHFGIGVMLETGRRDREAIEAFAAAVQHDPAYVEARFSLANALRRSGRVEESLSHYLEVLRINPAVSQAGFGYAMGLVRLGRYREARDRLERDVQSFPDQPGFAHALARLLAAAPDDQVRDGERALRPGGALDEDAAARRPCSPKRWRWRLPRRAASTRPCDGSPRRWRRPRRGGRTDMAAHLAANLRLYQARRPCRMPWTDDDPVHHPRPSQ